MPILPKEIFSQFQEHLNNEQELREVKKNIFFLMENPEFWGYVYAVFIHLLIQFY